MAAGYLMTPTAFATRSPSSARPNRPSSSARSRRPANSQRDDVPGRVPSRPSRWARDTRFFRGPRAWWGRQREGIPFLQHDASDGSRLRRSLLALRFPTNSRARRTAACESMMVPPAESLPTRGCPVAISSSVIWAGVSVDPGSTWKQQRHHTAGDGARPRRALGGRIAFPAARQLHLIAGRHDLDPRSAGCPGSRAPVLIDGADGENAFRCGRIVPHVVSAIAGGGDHHNSGVNCVHDRLVDDFRSLGRSEGQWEMTRAPPPRTARIFHARGDSLVGRAEVLIEHAERQQRRARRHPFETLVPDAGYQRGQCGRVIIRLASPGAGFERLGDFHRSAPGARFGRPAMIATRKSFDRSPTSSPCARRMTCSCQYIRWCR